MYSASTERYGLYVVNCGGPEVKVQGYVTFLNPGGEELSRELVPLVPVYATSFVIRKGRKERGKKRKKT